MSRVAISRRKTWLCCSLPLTCVNKHFHFHEFYIFSWLNLRILRRKNIRKAQIPSSIGHFWVAFYCCSKARVFFFFTPFENIFLKTPLPQFLKGQTKLIFMWTMIRSETEKQHNVKLASFHRTLNYQASKVFNSISFSLFTISTSLYNIDNGYVVTKLLMSQRIYTADY